jgi:hypothetical protein
LRLFDICSLVFQGSCSLNMIIPLTSHYASLWNA